MTNIHPIKPISTSDNPEDYALALCEELREIKEQIKTLEEHKTLIENNLKLGYFKGQEKRKHPKQLIINNILIAESNIRQRATVKGSELKKEEPEIYDRYVNISTWQSIDLKFKPVKLK